MEWDSFFNGLLVFVLGVLGFFGVKGGLREAKDTPATNPIGHHIEVAGALVDSTSVKALAGSIEGHSLALIETRADGRKIVVAVDGLRETVEKLGEILVDHRDEVRELRHEMRARR